MFDFGSFWLGYFEKISRFSKQEPQNENDTLNLVEFHMVETEKPQSPERNSESSRFSRSIFLKNV